MPPHRGPCMPQPQPRTINPGLVPQWSVAATFGDCADGFCGCPAPIERTTSTARNAHTQLCAKLCTHVPIVWRSMESFYLGKLRRAKYLGALTEMRIPGSRAARFNAAFPVPKRSAYTLVLPHETCHLLLRPNSCEPPLLSPLLYCACEPLSGAVAPRLGPST